MPTLNEAREAAYNQLVMAWNTNEPVPPLELDNEAFRTPEGGTTWARAVVREIKSQQETLGGVGVRRFRRDCNLIISIFVDNDKGTAAADPLAQSIRDAFEGLSVSGLNFYIVSVKEIGNYQSWYQVNVTASFWYEEIK